MLQAMYSRCLLRPQRCSIICKSSMCSEASRNAQPRVKVVGVGGGASNVMGSMWDSQQYVGPDLLFIDTDAGELARNPLPQHHKLRIGRQLLAGAGTNKDATMGRLAALESQEDLATALQDTDAVIVMVSIGGGTGNGAAPVVAATAREQGTFTVAVITSPVSHSVRYSSTEAVQALRDVTDALVIIPSHRLLAASGRPLERSEVYETADRMACAGMQGIIGMLSGPGSLQGVHGAEIQHCLLGSGSSWVGYGAAKGPERATRAALSAAASPLRLADISVCRSVMCHISGPPSLQAAEVDEVAAVITSLCAPGVKVVCEATTDLATVDAVAVTVIATNPGAGEESVMDPERAAQRVFPPYYA